MTSSALGVGNYHTSTRIQNCHKSEIKRKLDPTSCYHQELHAWTSMLLLRTIDFYKRDYIKDKESKGIIQIELCF
jgi:hypothetical protein